MAAIAAVSAPAAAQINPYGQVNPYNGTNNGGVVGAIVNAVTGYGQYPQGNYGYEQTSQRSSVEMCARTAEQRLNSDQRYNDGYVQNGYRNDSMFRVIGITNVERRANGALRVSGIASSDAAQGNSRLNPRPADDRRYGDNNGYSRGDHRYQNAGMDYRFTCKINSRGAVTSLNLDRGTRSLRG